MKRPTILTTYFQSSFQVVHVHKVSLSETFYKKWQLFENVNKFLPVLVTLNNFCQETYEKTYHFYDIFSKFWSIITCSHSFNSTKIFRKRRFFQYVKKTLLIFITLNNICQKVAVNFYTLTKFYYLKICIKKWQLFENVNKLLLIWPTLNNFCIKTNKKIYNLYGIFSKFLSDSTC